MTVIFLGGDEQVPFLAGVPEAPFSYICSIIMTVHTPGGLETLAFSFQTGLERGDFPGSQRQQILS